MKVIQKIKAWRYPHGGKIFYVNENGAILIDKHVKKLRSQAKRYQFNASCTCPCGKNCKPQRTTITVEVGR